ncbi:MAG: aldehyde dehydrogenase family protein, partial [Chlorobi bacterium]|nr:aldehyde dehydrogenase family protein [Chlorobiota bacterium]
MELISRNPATGEVIGRYAMMDDAEIETILDCIAGAQKSWRSRVLSERCGFLGALAKELERHRDEAAHLAALEMGKPITQGSAEIEKCIWAVSSLIEQAPTALAPLEVPTEFRRSRVVFDPLGVVLAIMPWNFPFWQVIRAAVPA